MKNLRFFIAICIVSVCVMSSVYSQTLLGNLNYWFSDSDYIYRYKFKPTISYSVGDNSGFIIGKLYDYVNHARTQWSTNGEMTSTYVGTNSDIEIFFGSYSQIANRIPGFATSTDPDKIKGGRTIFPGNITEEGNYMHTTGVKTCFSIDQSLIGVAYNSELTDNTYKNIVTHELGHGFGWIGHSSNTSHIMNPQSSNITTVNITEAKHLSQVKAY